MSWAGRGGQIRTDDPLLPKQMRYQAALRPDFLNLISRHPLAPVFELDRREHPQRLAAALGVKTEDASSWMAKDDSLSCCQSGQAAHQVHRHPGEQQHGHHQQDREDCT
jgi:hypothetical protein